MEESEQLIPFIDRDEMRKALASADSGQDYVVIRKDTLENIAKLTADMPASLYQESYISEVLSDISSAINQSIENGHGFVEYDWDEVEGGEIHLPHEFGEQAKDLQQQMGEVAVLAAKANLLNKFIPKDLEISKVKNASEDRAKEIESQAVLTAEHREKFKQLVDERQADLETIEKYREVFSQVAGIDRIFKD